MAAVVLNGVPARGQLGDEARLALKGRIAVAPVDIGNRIAFAHSLNDGRAAAELEPGGKVAQEVERLYRWLMKQAKAKADNLIPA
jgi:chromosome partitioning protein